MKALKIKNLFAGIAISFASLNPAHADFSVWGSSDCGEWVKHSKSSPTLKAWLMGYMSGIGVMYNHLGDTNNPLGKINSAEQFYLWMDNYCQKNPLSTVTTGGAVLFTELKSK